MPWKSIKQERWGNSPAGTKAMGKSKVEEFNKATKQQGMKKKTKGYESSKADKAIDKQLSKVGIKEDSKEDKAIDRMVQKRMKKRGK